MNNKMLKRIIVIIGIVVLCLIVLIAVLSKKTNNPIEDNTIEHKEEYAPTISKTFRKIDDVSMYHTTKIIIEDYVRYFQNINYEETVEIGRLQMTEKEIKDYQLEEGIKAIDTVFDKRYKEMRNISREDIISFAGQYKNNSVVEKYKIKISEEYIAELTDDKRIVLVYSKINNKDFNCMLKIDLTNNRYSIFYEDFMNKEKYTKDRTEEITIDDSDIEKNDYNIFIVSNLSNQNIVIQYFSDLKNKMKNDRMELYNSLDKDYRAKRFPSYEKFEQFLNSINDRINKLDISKFKFSNNQIKIMDNYDNIYTFNTSDIINYTIIMDDYTLEDKEITGIYNKSVDTDKVNTNIAKFFKMINLKDYESAYNLLDKDFKKQNYPSLDAFRKYIETNLFSYSKVTKINDTKKTGNYYIMSLNVINGEEDVIHAKQVTVVMQLLEGTNFVMSFSMN